MKRGKFEAQKPSRKPTAAQKHTGGASAPKQSGGGKKLGIILGCVILVAVLCVCAYGMILKGQDTIYPNVYVAGINVGGLKRDARHPRRAGGCRPAHLCRHADCCAPGSFAVFHAGGQPGRAERRRGRRPGHAYAARPAPSPRSSPTTARS